MDSKIFKNINYKIINNEGGGECLFAVIRQAFETIKKTYTVEDLRNIIADNINPAIFKNYISLYNNTYAPIHKLEEEQILLKARNNKIQELLSHTDDPHKRQELKLESDNLEAQDNYKLEEIEILTLNLNGLEYLQKLQDIVVVYNEQGEDVAYKLFQGYIKSCDFWGDSWAISILEYILNIKLILFSSIKYALAIKPNTKLERQKLLKTVLYCGDEIHPLIKEANIFNPMYYIIADFDGSHFQLITYKEQGIFTFAQLPIKIKSLIKKTCEPVESGSYHLIPEFKTYIPPPIVGGKRTKKTKLINLPENKLERKKSTKKKILLERKKPTKKKISLERKKITRKTNHL